MGKERYLPRYQIWGPGGPGSEQKPCPPEAVWSVIPGYEHCFMRREEFLPECPAVICEPVPTELQHCVGKPTVKIVADCQQIGDAGNFDEDALLQFDGAEFRWSGGDLAGVTVDTYRLAGSCAWLAFSTNAALVQLDSLVQELVQSTKSVSRPPLTQVQAAGATVAAFLATVVTPLLSKVAAQSCPAGDACQALFKHKVKVQILMDEFFNKHMEKWVAQDPNSPETRAISDEYKIRKALQLVEQALISARVAGGCGP